MRLNLKVQRCKSLFVLLKIGLYLLFSLGATCIVKAQNFGLRILTVSDSSQITSEMQLFDSLFYHCIQDYGKKDISSLFTANTSDVSKTHPITVLNFITGIDVPLNYVFPFKFVKNQLLNDSISIYQLDLGWMQLALPLNRNQKKLMRFESLNNFGLKKFEFKNLVIYSAEEVKREDVANAYNRIVIASKELGVNLEKFYSNTYTMYSANSIAEAYAYVGGLQYTSFFYPGTRYGGMGDPFNFVILSGVNKPIHVHELMHFAIDFPCSHFVNEGLASMYGGIGSTIYQENLKPMLGLIAAKNIHSIQDLYNLQIGDSYFNSSRGLYVLSAHLLTTVKSDLGLKRFREFVRNCKTNEQMIESLKILYHLDSEQTVFDYFFIKNNR